MILIGQEDPARTVILLDDRRGRRVADARGLRTLRTGAFLVAAVHRGLMTPAAVDRAVQGLRREHYLDERAAADILALLGAVGRG